MKLTPQIAELVGAIIGDGYIYRKNRKYQIGLVGSPITDKEYFEKLKQLILEEWNKEVHAKFRFRGLRMVFNSKSICEFLINDLNLPHGKGKGQRVIIPEKITSRKELISHTLRGIVDTDGSVYAAKKPGIEKYPSIEITTTSEGLANQLIDILTKMDFRARLRIEKRKDSKGFPSYRIALHGKKNLKKWIDEIGFSNPYKKQRAISYLN